MENKNMPLDFWSQVWQEGIIRFHQKDYNKTMSRFFKSQDLRTKSVLIPLAGKTNDILFFLEMNASVTAIEFVEQAVIDFFAENKISYSKKGNLYESGNLKFYAMDFFDFHTDKKFDYLYDRASQVVFTPNQRPGYYQHISKLIDNKTIALLAAIDHSGSPDYGPPYKIPAAEVVLAYKKMGIALKIYSEADEIPSEKMQNAGITALNSYFLTNL